MKSSLEGFKGRFEQTDKRISELEERTIEIIEEQKEKTFKKSEQNLKDTVKMYSVGVSEGKERQKRQKDYLKKQWSKTSPFDERHEHKCPRSSTNTKQNKLREIPAAIGYNQAVRKQR